MTPSQIRQRRLEIAVELAKLDERDCVLRRAMNVVEGEARTLQRELAELDLHENELGLPAGRAE